MSSIRILASTAALALVVSAAAAQAMTVQLTQSTAGPIGLGDLVSFDLNTSSDFPDIGGIQSQVTYDASVLSLVDVNYNSGFDIIPVGDNIATEAPDASETTTTGPFSAAVFSSVAPSGAVTLATFNFTAVGLGSTSVTIEPFLGFLVADLEAESLFNAPVSTSVTVVAGDVDMPAPVPLPAGALLLLTGVAGMSALRRRRKA